MRPIHVPANLAEMAYRSIRESILSGELKQEAWFNEERFAEALGMSRSPVREALNRLSVERLIEIVPRVGARVVRYSEEEIIQLLDLREALEDLAVKLLQPTQELIAELTATVRRGARYVVAQDVRRFIIEDSCFHLELVRASGNRFLVKFYRNLQDHIELVRWNSMRLPGRLALAQQHHESILATLKRGDVHTAGKLLSSHIIFLKRDLTTPHDPEMSTNPD